MNATITANSRRASKFAALLLAGIALSSCGLFKKKDASADAGYAGNNNAYASSGADGRYNPYPQNAQAPKYQEYTGNKSGGYETPTPPSTGPVASKKKKTTSSTTASGTKSSTKSGTTSRSSGSGTHIVKHGETLYSIAKHYHTTVSKLKSLNGLSSDVLRDGRKLKIP